MYRAAGLMQGDGDELIGVCKAACIQRAVNQRRTLHHDDLGQLLVPCFQRVVLVHSAFAGIQHCTEYLLVFLQLRRGILEDQLVARPVRDAYFPRINSTGFVATRTTPSATLPRNR